MREELLVELEGYGNNVSEFVSRMGGMESICVKLMKKFPDDTNYKEYMKIVEEGNYEKAEASIHTLKGVSSNLGLTTISEVSQQILNAIRNEDLTHIEDLNGNLKRIYESNIEIFKNFE